MKRIRFIAPVEAIQGNMSGRQTLKYADHDNPAYDAPKDKRSYARNYRPSYIGAFVAGTGVKYFAVKTKSAVRPTTKSLQAMALQGGAGALYAALISDQSAQIYQTALAIWESLDARSKVTMRKFYTDLFRYMLKSKSESVTTRSADGLLTLSIENPWVANGEIALTVSNEVLVKFWPQLATNPIEFSINCHKGVAHSGDTFGDVVANMYNVLNLTEGADDTVLYIGSHVLNEQGVNVIVDNAITNGAVFHTNN